MKSPLTAVLFLVVSAWSLCGERVHAREWSDATGRYRFDGSFIRLEGNYVYLMKTDGSRYRVQVERLSLKDREYVRGQTHLAAEVVLPGVVDSTEGGEMSDGKQSMGDKVAHHASRAQESSQLPVPLPVEPPSVVAAPLGKLAFHTYHGQFHLFLAPAPNGTALYWMKGCRYLGTLNHLNTDINYEYFAHAQGHPAIIEWAFSRIPDNCYGYSVWYKTLAGWRLYDYAHRECPR